MATPPALPMALTALRNLFSSPATRVDARTPDPQARGQLSFDVASCVFCGVCQRRCPSEAIEVSRSERRLAIEHLRCVLCGVCVDACTKHSLSLRPEPFAVQVDGPHAARGR